MTSRILNKETLDAMVAQLEDLNATAARTRAGVVVTAPNGKEVLRAMVGRSGEFLTRWPDGLFDAA